MEFAPEAAAVAAALLAVVFTVVPLVPGTLFVLAGGIALGLLSGFDGLPWWFWVGQVALALTFLLCDNAVQLLGLGRAGASRQAMLYATIGTFVGPLMLAPLGLLALLVGPVVGAAAGAMLGELRAQRPHGDAARAGWISAIAYVVSLVLKLAVLGVQIAWLLLEAF